jgi:competence protein ComEA
LRRFGYNTGMFSKHSALVLASCLFLGLISPLFVLPACNSTQAVEISITTRTPAFTGNIYIGGAVNNPGLYPLKQDDSLDDLIQAAGGLKDGADLNQVSLTIPDVSSSALPQRIDINRAEAWLLTALPSIGDTHARDIVAYREQNGPFRTVSDLLKVKGIGQATMDKIKDLITVSG